MTLERSTSRAVGDLRYLTLEQRAKRLSKHQFLGVPARGFERGGQEQFAYLRAAGLQPHSTIVDVGCGVLRAGYWLIRFLNPGCYHGIEPHTERLRIGMHTMLDPETLAIKVPQFDTNASFDSSVFGKKFDFHLAYSIWTHASKRQIEVMLDSFLRNSRDSGVFLTTYLPANWMHRDYAEDQWHGTSHESDLPGCIYHCARWIEAACARRGLTARPLGKDRTHRQSWLEITRSSA